MKRYFADGKKVLFVVDVLGGTEIVAVVTIRLED